MSDLDHPRYETAALPYRVAVLCYLWDAQDRLLLLHRRKQPNAGMHSPVGGKVEIAHGESPHECALREVHEETGVALKPGEMRLFGMVAERAYAGQHHWLLFLFECTRPVAHSEIAATDMDEGTLTWVPTPEVSGIAIPETDRQFMWPQVLRHRGGGFFVLDIDCSVQPHTQQLMESRPPPPAAR
jgi:8-oxo-dGTP diphosphatase